MKFFYEYIAPKEILNTSFPVFLKMTFSSPRNISANAYILKVIMYIIFKSYAKCLKVIIFLV